MSSRNLSNQYKTNVFESDFLKLFTNLNRSFKVNVRIARNLDIFLYVDQTLSCLPHDKSSRNSLINNIMYRKQPFLFFSSNRIFGFTIDDDVVNDDNFLCLHFVSLLLISIPQFFKFLNQNN